MNGIVWTCPEDELDAICASIENEGCGDCDTSAVVLVEFFAYPYFHAEVECGECGWSDERDLSGEELR